MTVCNRQSQTVIFAATVYFLANFLYQNNHFLLLLCPPPGVDLSWGKSTVQFYLVTLVTSIRISENDIFKKYAVVTE